MDPSFSEFSVNITKQLSKETKKEQGIYFTPGSIVKQICDLLSNFKFDSVLEPSCGSGQFLDYLNVPKITAIEKNEVIYNGLKQKHPYAICADFLNYHFEEKFDLVIGNPPYFVIPKSSVDKKYLDYFSGRPNIYIIFILKSFELLNDNGILAFLLPTNFLNCIYYNNLRKYLSKFNILHVIVTTGKFLETDQEICIFIVQKSNNQNNKFDNKFDNKFVIQFDEIVLFKMEHEIPRIKQLKENTTTLSKLNCTLNIGTVVWNQCKNQLTNDTSKTLLIYNGDFKNNVLEIQSYHNEKKNFINKKGSNEEIIVVNRGYGTGKYKFSYCLINKFTTQERFYLIENHCIVINSQDKSVFDIIIRSFENTKTKEFIELVF